MSGTEALLWTRLRGRRMGGWKFRRQQPIGEFFVDFYCPALRLVTTYRIRFGPFPINGEEACSIAFSWRSSFGRSAAGTQESKRS